MTELDDTQLKQPEGKSGNANGTRILVMLAAAIVILIGLRELRDLLIPIMLAAFLAIISYSVTDLLRKRAHFPHWLAVICTLIVNAGILFAIGTLIRFLAADMARTLQGEVIIKTQEKLNEIVHWLDNWGLGAEAQHVISAPQEYVGMDRLFTLSQTVGASAISFLSVTTLILVLMTFLLGEAPLFIKNLQSLPNSVKGKKQIFSALKGIQRYLFIKTIASACTGLLAWGLCAAMNVPFAFLWGVVAYVLNYIPTIGSIVAAVPPILVALLFGGWGDALVITGGYLAINFMIGNGIEPIFLGKQFGIATSVVLLSVLLWGWVWGPVGMFLAVPISVLTKLALENSKDLYWVAAIIDDDTEHVNPNLENNTNE